MTLHPIRRLLGYALVLPWLSFVPLSAQTITGDWYFTGLSVVANPGDIDPGSGRASGTVNIVDNGGGSFTATPGGSGWLGFDEVGTASFTQTGNRWVHGFDDGDETSLMVFEWLDADTMLWLSVWGEDAGENLAWFDGFAGILTRDALPVSNPGGWLGFYAIHELAVSTDVDVEGDFEIINGTLPITAGGGAGEYIVDGGDTFSLVDGALHFLEVSGSTWHDEALVVQLADGRLAYAYFGVGNDGEVITFADFGAGVASAVPEPSTYAAIFGALALGAVCVRRKLFPLNDKTTQPTD